jgi:hypothetical protein
MQFTTTKILVLAFSLVLAVGGWMTGIESFEVIKQPAVLGGLLAVIAGVVLSWLGESPRVPRGGA